MRRQIKFFHTVEKNISERMTVLITEIWNRMAENKIYKKQYPTLVRELMAIGDKHKNEAISQLVKMHKF